MRAVRFFRVAVAVALAAGAGCSLAVDASDIDEGCPKDHKLCEGNCVHEDDPAYGCRPEMCEPCAVSGIPECQDHRCTVKACLEGFCGPTCAVNTLVDEKNCGRCGTPCGPNQTCSNGTCVTN